MIVLDASVVVKCFVNELGHDEAIAVIASSEIVVAPDLVVPEVMNVLRRKQRQGLITAEQLMDVAQTISDMFFRLVPASNLVQVATSLSQSLDHSIYDCFYLACAISSGCALVTADQVFLSKAVDRGYGEAVVALSDWRSGRPGHGAEVDEATVASVIALHDDFQRTLDAVRGLVSQPFGSSGQAMVNTGDLKPAFDSPAYVKLSRFIARLRKPERAKLLALAWFGQSGEGGDWSLTLSRAEAYLSDDPTTHLPYIISKIELFGDGLRRLRSHSLERPAED